MGALFSFSKVGYHSSVKGNPDCCTVDQLALITMLATDVDNQSKLLMKMRIQRQKFADRHISKSLCVSNITL